MKAASLYQKPYVKCVVGYTHAAWCVRYQTTPYVFVVSQGGVDRDNNTHFHNSVIANRDRDVRHEWMEAVENTSAVNVGHKSGRHSQHKSTKLNKVESTLMHPEENDRFPPSPRTLLYGIRHCTKQRALSDSHGCPPAY